MGLLHETNPSLWVASSPETAFPHLGGSITVDVAVIGAGIAGLVVAARLKAEGKTVAVIEAGHVAAGATGYSTAKVTSQHGLHYAELERRYGEEASRLYAQANQMGLHELGRLVRHHRIDCDWVAAPAFAYTAAEASVGDIEAEVDAAVRAGLPATLTTETELPVPVAAAVRFDEQAHFHPRRFCVALAAAINGDGSAVFEHTRATDVTDGDPCTVATDRGEVTARDVVVCTQLPFLDRGGHFATASPVRSYVLAVRVDGPSPEGMYISAPDEPTRSIRPAGGGEWVLIGGEGHKVGQDPDEQQHYENLERWAREHFAVRSVDHRWSAQDYMPMDRVPYIGGLGPPADHVFTATGFQKWGFTTAGAAALILADAIAERENPWAGLFDGTRLPRGGFGQGLKENANVAKRFVVDRLSTITAPGPDSVAPGEGAVVRVGLKKVACYRDETGSLHSVSAECTHLGCLVAFNTAEKSWDCPCHGSRFTIDGAVINGPATDDLGAVPLDGPGAD